MGCNLRIPRSELWDVISEYQRDPEGHIWLEEQSLLDMEELFIVFWK